MLHLVNQTKLLFWKKMYTNSNVVLYTLSRYAGVPSRFMAVASQYGRIHSLRQTARTVKFAVWKFFYRDNSYLDVLILFCLMLYCTLVCVLCVLCLHFVATFCCNK